MNNKRRGLDSWITEALNDPDKSGPCTALALMHKVGLSDQEVHSCKIVAGATRTPQQLADLFRGKAEVYAQNMKSIQTFNLVAFYGTNEPGARQQFEIVPPQDHHGLTTEEATPQGAQQQAMRWADKAMAEAFSDRRNLMDRALDFADKISRHNQALENQKAEYEKMIMTMMLDKIKLDHESRVREMEAQRGLEERRMLMQLGPSLLNQIAGREVFPQSTADSKLIAAIADKVTPEQLAALEATALFPVEVMALLKTRFVEHLNRKAEEEKEVQKLLGFNKSQTLPEKTANGAKS